MTRNFIRGITALAFIGTALGIGILVLFPGNFLQEKKGREIRQPRIISPSLPGAEEDPSAAAERLAREDRLNARAALGDGELIVAVLNGNFDGDSQEEQLVAYRTVPGGGLSSRYPPETEAPIYITYIDYDEAEGSYRRVWSAPTSATRPLTLSLYTQDLIGDRGICVIVSGMNGNGEHTLTVFRKEDENGDPSPDVPAFYQIADIRIDGAVSVQETERTQVYRLGLARGQSFPIVAYGRDRESANLLDQLEITYTYNENRRSYEQSKIARIPGKEIEQRRVRELLSDSPGTFESFISGLWYYVGPRGTTDSRQYIYFDPPSRELIFYGDEAQQIFTWQNSSATRYGLYISSQNISITTLRRFLDIELESLDSIRVKVFEDVRLKIGVNTPWDGSYRKAAVPEAEMSGDLPAIFPYLNAVYESFSGRLRFSEDGSCELVSGENSHRGQYVFFPLDNREILELRSLGLRPAEPHAADAGIRETYLVERSKDREEGREKLSLQRVRLGARGIQELYEPAISLTEVF